MAENSGKNAGNAAGAGAAAAGNAGGNGGNASGNGGNAGGNGGNAASKKTSLFREKNLERLESPEKLNDYLRVTSPGVWMTLAAVIVLLIGVCIWGVFGTIQATTQAAIVTENGESVCMVPASALEGVLEYRTVKVDGNDLELQPAVLEPQIISESTNVYVMLTGGLSVGDIVYPISLAEPMKDDGIVPGTLVTETLSPAELFFN